MEVLCEKVPNAAGKVVGLAQRSLMHYDTNTRKLCSRN